MIPSLRKALLGPQAAYLTGITIIALGLRLWGIGFGLPYEYHVDEVQYVRQAARMGTEGLEPVWWNNPPFYKYMLLAEYAGLFGVGKLAGLYTSIADFGVQSTLDPTRLYLLGRGTTALLGVATVLVVYWLGKKAYNMRVGLLASWFLAVSFLHVRDSHYAVNDVPLTFFVTVLLVAAVRIVQTGKTKWYTLAGAALGLGFATKYSAAFAIVPLVVAHLSSPGVKLGDLSHLRARRFAVIPGVAGLASVLASPYFVLTPGKVVHDAYQALYLAGRHGFHAWQIDPAGGYVFYLKSLSWGLGWGLLLLTLAGLVVALLRHCAEDLVLLSLPIVMYGLMGRQRMYFSRFILPMVPALLVLGASLWEKVATSLLVAPRNIAIGLIAGALVVTGQPLLTALRVDHLWTRTDTRTLAKRWIESNIPEGAKIAVDWRTHGPPLSTTEQPRPGAGSAYDVLQVGGTGLSEHSIAWYRRQGFDYLIASSFIYRIPLVDDERDAERRGFYDSLSQELRLVQEVRPYREDEKTPFVFDEIYGPIVTSWLRQRPGPILKVYRLEG